MFRKLFLFLCFFCLSYQASCVPLFADEQKAPKKEDRMSDTFNQWDLESEKRSEQEEQRFTDLWKKTLVFLTVLVLFVFLAVWSMKRFSRFRIGFDTKQQARIQITDRRMLSTKTCLYIVSIDTHEMLIAESANGVQFLSKLQEPSN
jgi:flagellar biogenesis protein FliO